MSKERTSVVGISDLGSRSFRQSYGLSAPYIAGSMYKGIASAELVLRMARAGLLGFFGTGGLSLQAIEEAIDHIQSQLLAHQAYGMNLLCQVDRADIELAQVELFLSKGVRYLEAAAFMQITPALVRYRLHGVSRNSQGKITIPNRIIGKVSRPEVASNFMSPPPDELVNQLLASNKLTREEASLAPYIPVAHELCVESDSGGHTDQGVAYVLTPTILRLRDELQARFRYEDPIHIGAAGGIGTPEAAAAAFIMGADFILTGSINQCSIEADMSDEVKDMLQNMNIQDTGYAPAGDMFELGAKVQVLRKGVFFPARANKLYDLYKQFDSLDVIDEKTCQQIQEKYFKRSFDVVWQETKAYYMKTQPDMVSKAEANPKRKMALIFRWYFIYSGRLTRDGGGSKVDYQIHTGPALGAFNQWVKDTTLVDWRNRHVDDMANKLMQGAADLFAERFSHWEINMTEERINS